MNIVAIVITADSTGVQKKAPLPKVAALLAMI
jgi:hypothetical protein